jgi:hypothetical protein
MKRSLPFLLAVALFAPGCSIHTTTFHAGGTPQDERHSRRTTVDAFGGAKYFDLAKQCDGGWSEVTIENRIGEGTAETWRCRAPEEAEASSAPTNMVP